MAREDLRLKYEAKRKQLGLTAKWGREETRDVRLTQEHAVYAGMVEAMDLAVGKVLRCLHDLDLERNTLVVFTSDNGGLSTSEGWPTSNAPLRRVKVGSTKVEFANRSWPVGHGRFRQEPSSGLRSPVRTCSHTA